MSGQLLITGLYVPGDRPDRFEKAVGAGAHLVILDLEDAVAPDRKDAAREAVRTWLAQRPESGPVIQVRVNRGCEADLAMVAEAAPTVEVRLPKVESPDDVDPVIAAVGRRPVTALLETAQAVEAAAGIARHPGIARLALGESDLISDVGSAAPAVLDYARARVLFAAVAAGLPVPMLSAYPAIRDLEGLRRDTERGRDQGWLGRTAIHPRQLPVIAAAFRPSEEKKRWAADVLAALPSGGVATLPDGSMADPAMLGMARRILRVVEATRP